MHVVLLTTIANQIGRRVFVQREMFTSSNGDRANVSNVVIVVTDGAANEDRQLTVPYAVQLRVDGVYIVTMSVGTLPDLTMLNSIASLPTQRTVFTAAQGSQLLDYRDRLFMTTCDGTVFRHSLIAVVAV